MLSTCLREPALYLLEQLWHYVRGSSTAYTQNTRNYERLGHSSEDFELSRLNTDEDEDDLALSTASSDFRKGKRR